MAKAKKGKLTIEDALVPVEEQPYEIPENWCWTKINSVANVYTGNSINERVKAEKYEGQQSGLLFIATKDVDFDNSINYETNVRITDPENFKKVPANTALLCIEGGSAGRKIGFTNQEVCFGNKLCAFASDKIEPKYIYYFLQSNAFIYQFNDKKHGLIGGVSVKDLCEIGIALPPLEEQKRIVEQIENLFSKLDEAKDKAVEVLDKFSSRKEIILTYAFSGQLTSKWRDENGRNGEQYVDKLFSQIIVNGPQNGMYKPKSAYGSGTRILRIDCFYDGFLEPWDRLKRLDVDASEKQLYGLEIGDIVVNRVNSMPYLGKSALIRDLPEDCVFESNMMRIKIDDSQADTEYVIRYLNSPRGLIELRKNAKQAVNQASINQQDVKAVLIPLPSLDEQREVVRILKQIFENEEKAKVDIEEFIDAIDLMKKSILAKAFRGELGTNIPEEVSSLELLKQILD